MTNKIFNGSLTKIERSNELISELEKALDNFNKDDPVKIDYIIKNGKPELLVSWKGLPFRVGSILGDIIHNLRSSLDLLAVELVTLNNENPKNVYFPFSSSEIELDAQIKNKNFYKAGEKAVAILKSIKPYPEGNKPLRALHDLDIDDKHKRLLDTEKTMDINISAQYNIDDLKKYKLKYDCNSIQHKFESGCLLAGFPIIDTLNNIKAEIIGIIEKFLMEYI